MKRACMFYFQDEPGFAGYESRSSIANRLRAYRNARGNLGMKRFTVTRERFGRYTIRLNTQGSPVAVILTH